MAGYDLVFLRTDLTATAKQLCVNKFQLRWAKLSLNYHWITQSPLSSPTCTSTWWGGGNSQVRDCLLGLCDQSWRFTLKNHLGRHTRSKGPAGTLEWLANVGGNQWQDGIPLPSRRPEEEGLSDECRCADSKVKIQLKSDVRPCRSDIVRKPSHWWQGVTPEAEQAATDKEKFHNHFKIGLDVMNFFKHTFSKYSKRANT